MPSLSSCPDPAELQQLLQGALAPDAQSALEQHLDGCPRCQATLDRLSAGQGSWGDMAQQLAQPRAPIDPALASVMDKLQAEAPAETAADHRVAEESKLDFLDPPEKPGQLGKLAHYEVLELIGRGGMGIVLKAFDPKLHRVVAIKVMAPQLATSVTGRKRFLREAQAVAAVSHDHIVTIFAVDEAKGLPYLVMQYVAGRSLQQRIDEGGALEAKEILRIGMQAAHGLAAAHVQGLVHRDIKPANILLENGIERVKITDFGLARAVDGARVTQTGVVTGSPQYMAPEQARGEAVDHRADLFSLGGVMYAMCTGYAPFRASSSMAVLKKVCDESPRPIAELNPEIPDWLTTIVGKLMAKDPKDRFQSATEVANLLGQHLAHLQQPAVFPQPAEVARPAETTRAIRPAKKSLALPILLLVAPFILVAVILGSLLLLDLDFRINRLTLGISVLAGGACFLVGMILLVVQLASRPAMVLQPSALAGSGAAAPPRKPRRSNAWVVAAIVFLVAVVICPLPLLIIGGLGWRYLAHSRPEQKADPSDQGMSVPDQEAIARSGVTGELGRIGLAVANPDLQPWWPDAPSHERLLEGLSWFPEDSTFFGAVDLKPTGSLKIESPLMQTLLEKLFPPEMRTLFAPDNFVGSRLDRVSFAYVEHPQKTEESGMYIRLSGQFNRTRFTRLLLERIKDATAKPGFGMMQENVTLIGSPSEPPAIALVGDSDILLAGYLTDQRQKGSDEQLIQKALELRLYGGEGNTIALIIKPNLTAGYYAKVLANLPKSTYAVIMGDLPEALRREIAGDGKGRLRAVPRFVTITAAHEPDFLHFEASLPGPAEAGTFSQGIATLAKAGANELKSLPPGPAEPLIQELERISPKVEGNKVSIETNLSDEVLAACLPALKALPPWYGSAEAVKPVRMLKKFDPKTDKPFQTDVDGINVTVNGDSWRIERERAAGPLAVHLFDLPKQDVRGCTIKLRFKMKTEKVAGYALIELRLGGTVVATTNDVSATTEWKSYELSSKVASSAIEDIGIFAGVSGTGTIWLKDVELIKSPLSPPSPPSRGTSNPKTGDNKGIVLKKLDPKVDKPITTEISNRTVTAEGNEWKVEKNAIRDEVSESATPRVRLFEVVHGPGTTGRLILRFKARTERVDPAYLELRTQWVGNHSQSAKSTSIEGSTNWTDYEVALHIAEPTNQERVTIAVDLLMRNDQGVKSTIWIKDVELVKLVPVVETVIKKFDSKTDKPFQSERGDRFVTVEEDGWRIEAKKPAPAPPPGGAVASPAIRLFDLPKQNVKDSAVLLRFKMKTEKVTGDVNVELLVGGRLRNHLTFVAGTVSGTTNWKSYEVPQYDRNDSEPSDIAVVVDVGGTGTIWLKDVELVKVSSPSP